MNKDVSCTINLQGELNTNSSTNTIIHVPSKSFPCNPTDNFIRFASVLPPLYHIVYIHTTSLSVRSSKYELCNLRYQLRKVYLP